MGMIAYYFKHSRNTVSVSVAAGMASGACNAALLAVINAVLKTRGPTTALMWGFVALCVLLPATRFVSECLLTKLAQDATCHLRMKLCSQVLATPLRQLEQIGTPRLLAVLGDDIPTISGAILFFPLICVNAALVVGCLVYMGILSPALLAIVLGFMALGIASYQFPIMRVTRIFDRVRRDANRLQSHFRALTHGTKELKIHNRRRQEFLQEELNATTDSIRRNNIVGQNVYSAAASWGQTLVFVVIGLILFALPTVRPLGSGMIIAYTLTLLYFVTPLQQILNTLPQMSRAGVAFRNIEKLGLTLSGPEADGAARRDFKPIEWQDLELKSVTHVYSGEGEKEGFVLGPIDLSFKPGEVVFIVGGNGSGKTTLVKLLTGLYAPEKGHISLDGQPVGDADREEYRQQFSVVFADFYLFDRVLGLDNPKLDGEARGYLEKLKLADKVQFADGRFSTTELSQGQRKRLALLTAYLEDRPIYIFDEWAADQDPQFKSVFYRELLFELKAKGKTVFVISHDDRYYDVADRLIKLDSGQVVSDLRNVADRALLESAG
jgi:putative ATP-binding cassette transporter